MPEEERLRRLNLGCMAIARRGPDGEGAWVSEDQTVGLGHRRLAIIDLSPAGAQPMEAAGLGLRITFNGEIYNYRSLREELEALGRQFVTSSDTEVVLRSYAEFGSSSCSRLRGMYAFAIYDERDRSVFLARDPFGIKPLYVWRRGRQLWFSSQVKALVKAGLPVTPSAAGHAGFLLWGHVPSGRTMYREITELEPGTWVHRDAVGEEKRGTHFSLVDELASPVLPAPKSASEAREALGEALRESVRHHFVADVPVSLFLSSGRDSSTLLALSCEVAETPPPTVTLAFREYVGTDWDETPLAVEAARCYSSPHTVTELGMPDFREAYSQIVEAMDQPSVDGVNTFFVSKVARDAGFKVALSGLGADEIFQGYASFQTVPKLVRAMGAASRVPGFGRAVRNVTRQVLEGRSSPKYAGLVEYGGSYGGAYLLRRGLYMPWELPALLGREMAEEGLAELDTVPGINRALAPLKGASSRMVALESLLYMGPRLLRDSDWASMHHGLEIRVPFVDVPLLRTVVAALGSDFEYDKADLAAIPTPPLPEAILNRPKTGFMVPVHAWLRSGQAHKGDNSLRGWAQEIYKGYPV